jgi:hypothetical protein
MGSKCTDIVHTKGLQIHSHSSEQVALIINDTGDKFATCTASVANTIAKFAAGH